ESSSGQDHSRRAEIIGLFVEQLPTVSKGSGEASAVAASGSIIGRVWDSQGQPGGAAPVWISDGRAACAGKRRSMERAPWGLVLWRGSFPQGTAGASAGASGGKPLWNGAAGNGRREGRAYFGRGIEAAWVDRGSTERTGQRGRRESTDGAAAEARD